LSVRVNREPRFWSGQTFVSRWYAAQDLAASTMQNYRHHIEEHLLPTFEQMAVLIGMRWGEVVGLEPGSVRPATMRVEWQLYELDSGELLRCPPKDDSRHTRYRGEARRRRSPGWCVHGHGVNVLELAGFGG
jgi:hypothetical protein